MTSSRSDGTEPQDVTACRLSVRVVDACSVAVTSASVRLTGANLSGLTDDGGLCVIRPKRGYSGNVEVRLKGGGEALVRERLSIANSCGSMDLIYHLSLQSIEGLVTDETGLGLASARVAMKGFAAAGERIITSHAETKTDASGRFELAALAHLHGSYKLTATLEGYRLKSWAAVPVGQPSKDAHIILVKKRVLEGRLIGANRELVPGGAGIYVYDDSNAATESLLSGRITADSSGGFNLPLFEEGGTLTLSFVAPGYQRTTMKLATLVEGRPVELQLKATAPVEGIFVDEASHPIVGARLRFLLIKKDLGSPLRGVSLEILDGEATTGADGRFCCTSLSATATYRITAVVKVGGEERELRIERPDEFQPSGRMETIVARSE